MSYPKNQVVKFDTPKLGLGLFKKHYLGRFLELKERVAGQRGSPALLPCQPSPAFAPLHSNKHQASPLLLRHRPRLSISSRTWTRLRSQVPLPQLLCLRSFCLSHGCWCHDWYDGFSSLQDVGASCLNTLYIGVPPTLFDFMYVFIIWCRTKIVVELFLNLNYHIIYSYQIGIISNARPFSINQK